MNVIRLSRFLLPSFLINFSLKDSVRLRDMGLRAISRINFPICNKDYKVIIHIKVVVESREKFRL
jgi:hypothetical protein